MRQSSGPRVLWSALARLARAAALAIILGGLGMAAARSSPALAGPEPAPVPKRWELTLDVGPLRSMVVNVPDVGPRPFLYLTYRVVNNSGTDLLFAPAFDLALDDGAILRSGRHVPAEVTKTVIERLNNSFLEDQIAIIGQLLQGKENSKEGVVIWPLVSIQARQFNVYCGGFSGETATVEVPNPETGELDRFVLRKTLMLRYRAPGEINPRSSTPFDVIEQRWIMR